MSSVIMNQLDELERLNLYCISKADADDIDNLYSYHHRKLAPAFQSGYLDFYSKKMNVNSFSIDNLAKIIEK